MVVIYKSKDRAHTQEGIYADVEVCDYGQVHWTVNYVTVSCNYPAAEQKQTSCAICRETHTERHNYFFLSFNPLAAISLSVMRSKKS